MSCYTAREGMRVVDPDTGKVDFYDLETWKKMRKSMADWAKALENATPVEIRESGSGADTVIEVAPEKTH